jgi:sensor histidine kinase regulating citrate/malate metabolism
MVIGMNIEPTLNMIIIFLLVSFVALLLMFIYTKKVTKKMREEKEKAEADRIARQTAEKKRLKELMEEKEEY